VGYSNKTNQPDASISQIYCSSFKYSSTCFGHPHSHHQGLINCTSRLRFTVGTWCQQCRWSWLERPRPMTLLPPRSNGKPEAASAVYGLLMMGMRMPETCWAVFATSNKSERLMYMLGLIYLNVWWCTDLQTQIWVGYVAWSELRKELNRILVVIWDGKAVS